MSLTSEGNGNMVMPVSPMGRYSRAGGDGSYEGNGEINRLIKKLDNM